MKPDRGANLKEVEVTDLDRDLMSTVENAFSASRRIRSNLKSMTEDIGTLVECLVDEDKAFSSLEDLFSQLSNVPINRNGYGYRQNRNNRNNDAMGNIKTFLAALLLSAIKNENSRLGTSEPVYKEEVAWMAKKKSSDIISKFESCASPVV